METPSLKRLSDRHLKRTSRRQRWKIACCEGYLILGTGDEVHHNMGQVWHLGYRHRIGHLLLRWGHVYLLRWVMASSPLLMSSSVPLQQGLFSLERDSSIPGTGLVPNGETASLLVTRWPSHAAWIWVADTEKNMMTGEEEDEAAPGWAHNGPRLLTELGICPCVATETYNVSKVIYIKPTY